jgi:hypothetical protein
MMNLRMVVWRSLLFAGTAAVCLTSGGVLHAQEYTEEITSPGSAAQYTDEDANVTITITGQATTKYIIRILKPNGTQWQLYQGTAFVTDANGDESNDYTYGMGFPDLGTYTIQMWPDGSTQATFASGTPLDYVQFEVIESEQEE